MFMLISELYIQFGYVVLFSSVAPLAAFWAFLNNILEIRLDAYKVDLVFCMLSCIFNKSCQSSLAVHQL